MMALVILYVVGIGALVAGAAAAIDWSVQGRLPTRHVWTVAIIATVVLPPLAVARHSRPPSRPAGSATQGAIVEVVQFGRDAGAAMGSRDAGTPLHVLRTRFYTELDRIEHVPARTIAELWAIASLGLLAWIATGLAHWQRERREWEETEFDGVSVHLSDETGPAVLGIMTQCIVLPAWARTLAPEYRQLMLAHECEHIAARDPQRLALALAALVVMPWNPALWWCAARMRRAIEMDCDARVLRQYPTPREYGYLLLQVAARGTNAGPLAVPLVNLLRLPSELELRLCAMTRPKTIAGRTVLIGAAIASVAVLAAFTTPVPRVARLASRAVQPSPRTVEVQRTKPRAWVVEHDSLVELDSVTYDPKLGITQGVLPPRLRRVKLRDTLPSAKAEDSLRLLARALAERSRQVDSMQAELRAMTLARDSQSFRPNHFRARVDLKHPGNTQETAMVAAEKLLGRDSVDAALKTYFDRSGTRIDAALKQYYPNLAADATSGTVVWFLADSSGHVVRTVRKEGPAGMVSAQSAAGVFGNVDSKDIGSVSIRKWTAGDRRLAVAWIELKK